MREAYDKLSAGLGASLAVRSSAHCGRHAGCVVCRSAGTFLHVRGIDAVVMTAIKRVFASLFNDRAISTGSIGAMTTKGSLSPPGAAHGALGSLAASGVMFTLDTRSGFSDVVFITGPGFRARWWFTGAVQRTSSMCASRPSRPGALPSGAPDWAPSSSR